MKFYYCTSRFICSTRLPVIFTGFLVVPTPFLFVYQPFLPAFWLFLLVSICLSVVSTRFYSFPVSLIPTNEVDALILSFRGFTWFFGIFWVPGNRIYMQFLLKW